MKKIMKVKPVFTYELFQRKEKATWRNWTDIETEQQAKKEEEVIKKEIEQLKEITDFPVEFMQLDSIEYDGNVPGWEPKRKDLDKIFYDMDSDLNSCDAIVIWGAGGGRWSYDLLEALVSYNKPTILFVRYKSGNFYLPYEMISVWLRKFTDNIIYKGFGPDDIVIDDLNAVADKLRSVYGIINTVNQSVICLGYPSGMDKIDFTTLTRIRKIFGLNIKNYSYSQLAEEIKAKNSDKSYLQEKEKEAEEYLKQSHVVLKTKKEFISKNFVLKDIFKGWMEKNHSYTFTIGQCMSGIAPIAETTACLTLGVLNDTGFVAQCEGDFVCIPANMMLHSISGKPTFLADPTWANNGMVSLAHCAGTSKMDGQKFDRVEVMTHFESDYGAAQRVHLEVGREVTVVIPDFDVEKYILFTGKVLETPEKSMCRSHVDISIDGDYRKLNAIMRGFHWLIAYGNYKDQVKYALNKLGIEVLTIE